MATTLLDASVESIAIEGVTGFKDISFSQGTGLENEPSITSLVINYGDDSIVVENYFTATEENGDTVYNMSENAVNTFNVGGQNYTLEWKHSNVTGEDSMYNVVNNSTKTVADIKNWVNSGEGNDFLTGQNEYDMLAGNGGNDTISAGVSNKVGVEIYGGEGNDSLTGSEKDDWIAGNEGNDELHGGAGNDYLFGGDWTSEADAEGEDSLYGDDGNDSIYGRGGNDVINGGKGDDLIIGGKGNDILTGGDGVNTFAFNLGDGQDIITDAKIADVIKFNDAEFTDLNFSVALNTKNLVITNTEDALSSITVKDFYGAQNPVDIINAKTATATQDYSILKDADIFVERAGNSTAFVGNKYNETVNANALNETFEMGAGHNTINFEGNFGNDTVKLSDDETLNLNIKTIGGNASDSISYEFSNNKKDLIISSNVSYY
ncbi:hypothetical protein II906_00445, partial [bacterium]|nr:hypothetical protein [bacterium]